MTTARVIVDNSTTTVRVIMTGGILMASSSLLVIDGFVTAKGAGNVAPTHEIGDFVSGWIGTTYVAGRINNLPLNDVSDLDMAVQGTIL